MSSTELNGSQKVILLRSPKLALTLLEFLLATGLQDLIILVELTGKYLLLEPLPI